MTIKYNTSARLFLLLLFFVHCKGKPEVIKEQPNVPNEVIQEEKKNTIIRIPHYYLQVMNEETTKWIQSIVSEDSIKVLMALNRVEKRHLLQLDTLVLTDTFSVDINYFSPFPLTNKAIEDIHKIIIYSYPLQAFAAYENGTLVRWGPVSMGKQTTPTPTGLFHTNWKAKQTVGTVNEEWIMNWYFNLDNFDGVSMHEYNLPGFPASHSCVRLLTDDAFWFYNWAEQWILSGNTAIVAYGTPVVIYGDYPFVKRIPWREIDAFGNGVIISDDELQKEVNDFIPLIIQRQEVRDSVISLNIKTPI